MKPYFETDLGQLYHGDCLEVMSAMTEKADLICIDPPYNIGKDSWDKIPDYQAWMGKVFLGCQEVLKDNGSFYWFHNKMPVIARLMGWLEENTEFVFKQLITWNKYFKEASNVGFCKQRLSNPENRNYYGGFTEYCLFYTFQDETGLSQVMLDENNFSTLRVYFKELQAFTTLSKSLILSAVGQKADHCFRWNSSQWDLPTKETYEQLIEIFRIDQWKGFKEYEDLRKEYEDLRYTFNNQRVTGGFSFQYQNWNNSVWNYSAAPQIGHLTPKPVPLISNIIKHSSNPGDLCVDFFGGSGTLGEACENLNRRWILCEISEKYCEIAAKRIEAAASQMSF